jgi:predicted PhzF superfamily epimerase YddE/YHI9
MGYSSSPGGFMEIPIHHLDAFVTDGVFTGNPAAVCPLGAWLPDEVMQKIATENNLSETAFFVGGSGEYQIRWMTPVSEIDLCGHATLASAHVVFTTLEPGRKDVRFHSKSGPLSVRADGDRLVLDFPSRPAQRRDLQPEIAEALGRPPVELWFARDYFAVFATADEVRGLAPDMARLRRLDLAGVAATAPGSGDVDFVSRFFAPGYGIDEDPATGSTHCTLVPYWSHRLGKTRLHARQLSARGGDLVCEDLGQRVAIAGRVASYLEGTLKI